ncbi:MAG TPA: hypothetical protein VLB46_14765 [Pyrinomonadaceae bacterium]|nr:hypothetical protein [Pyrinomonadaceae bacterium]
MKRCPTCNRTYTDLSLNFCLEDGTPLTADAPPIDPNATIRYPSARDTQEPPPTEIYRPQPQVVTPRPSLTPPPPPSAPPWTPGPTAPPRKKSNAVWWVLGGLAAVLIIGIGVVVMIIALASLGSSTNTSNLNSNTRNENRNSNINANANANVANANANATIPSSIVEDFSNQSWNTGVSEFGRRWYEGGEYHMSSRERTFVVIYAPTDAYSTENATVKVTARSVNGDVPSSGFGLMVHCALSKARQLEDYALVIYPSDEPAYEIIKHKDGNQSSVVTRTKSNAIRTGEAPNVLEVRINGAELSFYANGQFLTSIKDTENFRHGRAGLYTSDVYEVAFDDLTIDR